MIRITVPGEMPGLNEIIASAKQHYGSYSSMKRGNTEVAAQAAHIMGRGRQVERAVVRCHWVAESRRRDPDNIAAGVKFLLDGLVQAGVLPGDGWRHVAGLEHAFSVDKRNPRVEIEIEEVAASDEEE